MKSGDIPDDLKKLDEKIRRISGNTSESGGKGQKGYSATSRIGIAVTADLIAGVLVGTGIGYVLDNLFGTKPIFLAVFVLLGGAAGVLNMYRTVKEEDKKGN